jgi:A/G-specific adenine glycosylase
MTSATDCNRFLKILWDHYDAHNRTLPWRVPNNEGEFDPYHILVSELMLQQTQVSRVIPKYQAFLSTFPSVTSLAGASLGDVLALWSGLGYNRRAGYLHVAAGVITKQWRGTIPADTQLLQSLPGVGHNTAAAIVTYAFNQPTYFIETNVRTVYLHHFFADKNDVTDDEILIHLQATLDQKHPREFYWALMDYGSHLKSTVGNQNKRSKHYAKQSRFQGSRRQVRGRVLKQLLNGPASLQELDVLIRDERLSSVLEDLTKEKLVIKSSNQWHLP